MGASRLAGPSSDFDISRHSHQRVGRIVALTAGLAVSALCFGGVAVTAVSVAQPPVVVATTPPPALSAVSLPVAWEAPALAVDEGSRAAELASAALGGR